LRKELDAQSIAINAHTQKISTSQEKVTIRGINELSESLQEIANKRLLFLLLFSIYV
jgi:hypothetical protein